MIYRFLLLSNESEDFVREISIDSDATFFDLHNAILDSVGYTKDQITSFFLCEDGWEKSQEITLMDMGGGSSEFDMLVMDETSLRDYMEEEGQRLLYVYDSISDRMFFIELKEIVPSQYLDAPQCTFSQGEAPAQMLTEDDFMANLTKDVTLSNTIYDEFSDDEDFDMDELDSEGFSDLDSIADDYSNDLY